VLAVRSSLVAFVVMLGATRIAQAQPTAPASGFSASVEFVAPPHCPSASDFEAVVVGRLGFNPFEDGAAHDVLVTITPSARGLEGRLEWRDANGKWAGDQAFPAHTRDCADLTRAMGFALAVQLTLLMTGESKAGSNAASADDGVSAPPETRRPAPSPSKAVAPAQLDAEGGRDAARPGQRWTPGLGAGGSFAVGLSPGVTALGRVFGSLARGRGSVELGAELSTLSSEHREDGAGFTQRVLLASAAACGTEASFTACLLAKGGVLQVAGQDVDVPASPSGLAAQLGVRVGLRQLAGPVLIAERVEALANLTRTTVTLDRLPVWTAPAFAATVGLDVGFIFD
jgi:hypothetical protein